MQEVLRYVGLNLFCKKRKIVEGELTCGQGFFEKIEKKIMPEIFFPSHQSLPALNKLYLVDLSSRYERCLLPNTFVQLLLSGSWFFLCETRRLLYHCKWHLSQLGQVLGFNFKYLLAPYAQFFCSFCC